MKQTQTVLLTAFNFFSLCNVNIDIDNDSNNDSSNDSNNDSNDNSTESSVAESEKQRRLLIKEKKETAKFLAKEKKKKIKSKQKQKNSTEPETLIECLYKFRVLQVQLSILLYDLMLPNQVHNNTNQHIIQETMLPGIIEVLEPILTKTVLTLCEEEPFVGVHSTKYFRVRARLVTCLFSCRLQVYNTLTNIIDEESICLEEKDMAQEKRSLLPCYWVCSYCHLVNQPKYTKTCMSCQENKKVPVDKITTERRIRRENYRSLHLRAAKRAQFSAELCEDIANKYPLQSAHVQARLFRILESRSLIAGARAVPVDHGKKTNSTNSVLLAQKANENLNKYWRHDTSMLFEGRAVLYGCLYLRLITDFNKTKDLFMLKQYKIASNRYRAIGKSLTLLMEDVEEDIKIEKKHGDRIDYIVIGGGKTDWRQDSSDNPQDWVAHEDEHGRKYWYSPMSKKTTFRKPPPKKKLQKRRPSSPPSKSENGENGEDGEDGEDANNVTLKGFRTPPRKGLPALKTKKGQPKHLGFYYWGERIHVSEPLGKKK